MTDGKLDNMMTEDPDEDESPVNFIIVNDDEIIK